MPSFVLTSPPGFLTLPDFPQKGIVFLDFLPLLRDPQAFEELLTTFQSYLYTSVIPKSPSKKIDVVVGLDAR